MSKLLEDLRAPFPPAEIEWRVGSTTGDKSRGLALAYITARHVMNRLDDAAGPENWQDRYEFHGGRTVCYLSIRVNGEWIVKADGAGDSDVEAEKGSISDALKRAAVKWGIGRYLYDIESPWVALEPQGRTAVIAKHEYARLAKILPGAKVAKPEEPQHETQKPSPYADNPFDDGKPAALSKDKARPVFTAVQTALRAAAERGLGELFDCWTDQRTAIFTLPEDWRNEVIKLAIAEGMNLAANVGELGSWWREWQPQITAMPKPLVAELTREKDAAKARLSQQTEAAE